MNLFKSTTTFSFFTIISRILGYIRDILIAIFLGSGPLADAFFVAFRIPNTFRRLFSEGTFNAAFVPSYASELANGKDQSEKFATSVFSLLIISLFFLVLIIEIFMPIFDIQLIISFESEESISKSIASISAKRLNSTAFPSITGLEAKAPKLPIPRIAEPLLITATKFPLVV